MRMALPSLQRAAAPPRESCESSQSYARAHARTRGITARRQPMNGAGEPIRALPTAIVQMPSCRTACSRDDFRVGCQCLRATHSCAEETPVHLGYALSPRVTNWGGLRGHPRESCRRQAYVLAVLLDPRSHDGWQWHTINSNLARGNSSHVGSRQSWSSRH